MLTDVHFQEDWETIHTLTSIVVVSPHGSVEDERPFSSLNFVKNALRNRLSQEHLNAALRVRSERGKSTGKIFDAESTAWVDLWSEDFERRYFKT
jgi:hypothetical protein